MRQIVVAVIERRRAALKLERSHIEWQTRAITMFVAQTAQSRRAAKSLTSASARLSMERRSTGADLVAGGSIGQGGPGGVSGGTGPPRGSFERLMAGFGRPPSKGRVPAAPSG